MNILQRLDVQELINAVGTKTWYGGSALSSGVCDAMQELSKKFCNIDELNRAVGREIAEKMGAEDCLITSGAAAAIVLQTAASMTGLDEQKIRNFFIQPSENDEIIIQKTHVGHYAYLHKFAGAKLIETGNMVENTLEDIKYAITSKTAAISYVKGPNLPLNSVPLAAVVNLAKRHNLPVIVDAAAMLPPKTNLKTYLGMGADLVAFSGGKMLRGPQNTGILAGRKDLVEAARRHSSPHLGIGRPFKVTKEDIVGLYVAFLEYLDRDEGKERKQHTKLLNLIVSILDDFPGIYKKLSYKIMHDEERFHLPTLVFHEKHTRHNLLKSLSVELRNWSPPIIVSYQENICFMAINPLYLEEHHCRTIAHAITKITPGL